MYRSKQSNAEIMLGMMLVFSLWSIWWLRFITIKWIDSPYCFLSDYQYKYSRVDQTTWRYRNLYQCIGQWCYSPFRHQRYISDSFLTEAETKRTLEENSRLSTDHPIIRCFIEPHTYHRGSTLWRTHTGAWSDLAQFIVESHGQVYKRERTLAATSKVKPKCCSDLY